jgi:hypothetical protein
LYTRVVQRNIWQIQENQSPYTYVKDHNTNIMMAVRSPRLQDVLHREQQGIAGIAPLGAPGEQTPKFVGFREDQVIILLAIYFSSAKST